MPISSDHGKLKFFSNQTFPTVNGKLSARVDVHIKPVEDRTILTNNFLLLLDRVFKSNADEIYHGLQGIVAQLSIWLIWV